eukprot:5096115-Prymnesium_polylepis.2
MPRLRLPHYPSRLRAAAETGWHLRTHASPLLPDLQSLAPPQLSAPLWPAGLPSPSKPPEARWPVSPQPPAAASSLPGSSSAMATLCAAAVWAARSRASPCRDRAPSRVSVDSSCLWR